MKGQEFDLSRASGYDSMGRTARFSAGYNFVINDKFSIAPELGVAYYGNESVESSSPYGAKINYWGFDLSGVGTYQLTPKWDIFAKAGLAYIKHDLTDGAGDNHVDEVSSSSISPLAGLGVSYNFNSNWALSLSYTHIFKKSDEVKFPQNTIIDYGTSLDSFLLGIKYTF